MSEITLKAIKKAKYCGCAESLELFKQNGILMLKLAETENELKKIKVKTAKSEMLNAAREVYKSSLAWNDENSFQKTINLVDVSKMLVMNVIEINEDFIDIKLFKSILTQVITFSQHIDANYCNRDHEIELLKEIKYEIENLINNTENQA